MAALTITLLSSAQRDGGISREWSGKSTRVLPREIGGKNCLVGNRVDWNGSFVLNLLTRSRMSGSLDDLACLDGGDVSLFRPGSPRTGDSSPIFRSLAGEGFPLTNDA